MAIVQEPRGTQQHIKSDADPKPGIRCSLDYPWPLSFIPSVGIDFATFGVAILAIAPGSSITQPQFMETTA